MTLRMSWQRGKTGLPARGSGNARKGGRVHAVAHAYSSPIKCGAAPLVVGTAADPAIKASMRRQRVCMQAVEVPPLPAASGPATSCGALQLTSNCWVRSARLARRPPHSRCAGVRARRGARAALRLGDHIRPVRQSTGLRRHARPQTTAEPMRRDPCLTHVDQRRLSSAPAWAASWAR